MGKAGHALPLIGQCLEVPRDQSGAILKCTPFREFCIHTTMSNPYGGGSVDLNNIGGMYSCDKRHAGAANGTGVLPVFSTPSGSVPYGKVYGRTGSPITLPGFFKADDVSPWEKRPVYPERQWYAQGPAITSAHCAIEVRRRLKGVENNSYAGRQAWNMTDSDWPLKQGADWMGPMHPANCLWSNKEIDEPLLAGANFETCGVKPQVHFWFCSPLPAYGNAAHTQRLGSYIGLSLLHVAGSGYIRKPLRQCTKFPCEAIPPCGVNRPEDKDNCVASGFLPENYFEPPNPVTGKRPVVNPTWQFMFVETSVYMVGDTPELNSPRIGSVRHWFINRPFQPNNNPCDEYFYTHYSTMQEYWRTPVTIVSNGSPSTIDFNLSGFQVYCTP
jgi:hypothetical protein